MLYIILSVKTHPNTSKLIQSHPTKVFNRPGVVKLVGGGSVINGAYPV